MAVRFDVIQEGNNGRDRDRTDDLYRVKVALIPTELRARRIKFYNLSGSQRPAFFIHMNVHTVAVWSWLLRLKTVLYKGNLRDVIRQRRQGKNRNRLSNFSFRNVFLRIRALHRNGCPWPEASAFLYWSEAG